MAEVVTFDKEDKIIIISSRRIPKGEEVRGSLLCVKVAPSSLPFPRAQFQDHCSQVRSLPSPTSPVGAGIDFAFFFFQLTYDYQFDFEDDQHKIPCHCGAWNCRKWMN